MATPHETHGAFSWFELTTSDPKSARAFYGKMNECPYQDRNRDPTGP